MRDARLAGGQITEAAGDARGDETAGSVVDSWRSRYYYSGAGDTEIALMEDASQNRSQSQEAERWA